MTDKDRMADRYRTFDDLAANERLGIDYRIRIEDRGAPFVILAPHGGRIEPGTSEIAEAIAGTDLSFYAFEALKNGAHGDFHISSHGFDEPKAIDLVGRSRTAIAIHGRRDEGRDAVWLGGRAMALRNAIGASLRDAGFEREASWPPSDEHLQPDAHRRGSPARASAIVAPTVGNRGGVPPSVL
jgi:phage replication-related protein YjqB (UPF0714/DUF867 family)